MTSDNRRGIKSVVDIDMVAAEQIRQAIRQYENGGALAQHRIAISRDDAFSRTRLVETWPPVVVLVDEGAQSCRPRG